MKTYTHNYFSWLGLLCVTFLHLSTFNAAFASPKGEALYLDNCAICHGNEGEGGMGIPLSLNGFLTSASNEYLKHTIRYGRPNRVMPSFYWMQEADIDEIIQYINGWRSKPAPIWNKKTINADANAGKTLFKNKCAACHGEDAKGGVGSGMFFSRPRDLPITPPALNNQGLLNSAPDAMLHFIIKHGRKGTPMPSAASLGLNNSDINNLVSYLRSLQVSHMSNDALYDEEPAVITVESPYSFAETIENVKRAIVGSNFIPIRDQALTDGFKIETDEANKQTIIYFCSFGFLYEALKIDPRVGIFLPCRITVVEHNGKVLMMSINPKHLSQLFNNDELDDSCDQMYDMYTGILEDASL